MINSYKNTIFMILNKIKKLFTIAIMFICMISYAQETVYVTFTSKSYDYDEGMLRGLAKK